MTQELTKICSPLWKQRTHDTLQQHLARLQTPEGQQSKIILIGSSMVERFETTGNRYKEKYFDSRGLFIAGVGGDKIQHMLYRIENGLLEACPQLETIILMGGSNNLECNSAPAIVHGLKHLISQVQLRKPNANIVLFGISPRGSEKRRDQDPVIMEKIRSINSDLAKIEGVRYYDFCDQLLGKDGLKNPGFYADNIHFNQKGYGLFAKAILASLDDITGS
jgi:lysophospholipase L1-like esterase